MFTRLDKVDKVKGYRYPGTVVGIIEKLDGQIRYAVELDELGMLHIFSEKDLTLRHEKETKNKETQL